MICRRCQCHHDGSLMRVCGLTSAAARIIGSPEIPKTDRGEIELCHDCQRAAHMAGGGLNMLMRDLETEATKALAGPWRRKTDWGFSIGEEIIAQLRWPESDGIPYCPRCGAADIFRLKSRNIFKCDRCSHQFSLTSGWVFGGIKMPIDRLLTIMKLLYNGYNAHQVSILTCVQYKTAWNVRNKMRSIPDLEAALGGWEMPVDSAKAISCPAP